MANQLVSIKKYGQISNQCKIKYGRNVSNHKISIKSTQIKQIGNMKLIKINQPTQTPTGAYIELKQYKYLSITQAL